MNRSLRTNITTIYIMGFLHSFMVVVPVFVPLLQGFGLSMSEVLQTQALFAMTVALCEVPSGYIADMWGRRRVIVVGSLLNGFGFLSLLWADSFFDFLIYELILGVGISLISGADLALLYDTETWLAEQGDGGGQGTSRSLSRLISIEAGASGLAGISASLLLLHSMDMLIVIQVMVGFLPFVLSLRLVESPRPKLHLGHSGNAGEIVRLLLFGKPVLLWTGLAIVCFGLASLYSFWLYQKDWELRGIPVEHFGYIWAAFALTVSLTARYAPALEKRLGWRRLLVLAGVLPFLGWLGMAVYTGWIGLLFGFAIQASRGLTLTLFYDALNSRVPGDYRATVNSLVSLGVRGAFILTGPGLGYLLDSKGIQFTLLTMIAIFAPLVFVLMFGLLGRIDREQLSQQREQPAVVSAGI